MVIEAECAAGKPQFFVETNDSMQAKLVAEISASKTCPAAVSLSQAAYNRQHFSCLASTAPQYMICKLCNSFFCYSVKSVKSKRPLRVLPGRCAFEACAYVFGVHWPLLALEKTDQAAPLAMKSGLRQEAQQLHFSPGSSFTTLKEETRCFWHPQFRCTKHSPCPIGSVEGCPGIRGWESFEAANQRAEWNEVRQCLPGCICSDICIGRVRATQNC